MADDNPRQHDTHDRLLKIELEVSMWIGTMERRMDEQHSAIQKRQDSTEAWIKGLVGIFATFALGVLSLLLTRGL